LWTPCGARRFCQKLIEQNRTRSAGQPDNPNAARWSGHAQGYLKQPIDRHGLGLATFALGFTLGNLGEEGDPTERLKCRVERHVDSIASKEEREDDKHCVVALLRISSSRLKQAQVRTASSVRRA
jgi:hypothetical protein